ncbi:hypothetical protein GN956_G1744 [Arapaima gigas]
MCKRRTSKALKQASESSQSGLQADVRQAAVWRTIPGASRRAAEHVASSCLHTSPHVSSAEQLCKSTLEYGRSAVLNSNSWC